MMLKFTDPNYKLPKVLAMQLSGTATSGANRPLIIKGLNIETKTSGNYVLKYRGAERMDEAACGRELLTSFLVSELEIPIPKPVLVEVTNNFLITRTIQAHPDFDNINKSKGINFGCEYLKGNVSIHQNQKLSDLQKKQAASIFLFDMMMQNSDRWVEKPNMFIAKENIYVIDHELPYGFLATFSFLASSSPCILNDIDIKMGKRHFFYPFLHKNRSINWEETKRPFLEISDSFWQKALYSLPENWMSKSDFERTKKHFTEIQLNFETFNQEIWNKILMA